MLYSNIRRLGWLQKQASLLRKLIKSKTAILSN